MSFQETIQEYERRFTLNGRFNLLSGQIIHTVVREQAVPRKHGVYVMYDSIDCTGEVIYIGRSGTMTANGNFKNQCLRTRLTAKQENRPRSVYFQDLMNTRNVFCLSFKWFITFDEENKVLPGFAEAELMQVYFNENKRLPILNKEF